MGPYGNLFSSQVRCGERFVLLEVREQHPERTGREAAGDLLVSGRRAGGHRPPPSWQSHSSMPKEGYAATTNGPVVTLILFLQIFRFLPIELSKAYPESPVHRRNRGAEGRST